ncbi:MAG: hypothetical protein ACRCX2_33790 [Paraclostridium sp.]
MPRKAIDLKLDFSEKNTFNKIMVKQFDDVLLDITPVINGDAYNVSNMTAKIFIGAANDVFLQEDNITISDNKIQILLDRNMLQHRGRAYAEVDLTDSEGTISSSSFLIDIELKIGEGQSIPGGIQGFVEKYRELVSQFESKIQGADTIIQDAISGTIKEIEKKADDTLSYAKDRVDGVVEGIEADYESLHKVIIDENQAALLQSEINKTNSQLETKANYDFIYSENSKKRDKTVPIEMSDLSTLVKESMTGGSVAVVGRDAVGSENLKAYSSEFRHLNLNHGSFENNLGKILTNQDTNLIFELGAISGGSLGNGTNQDSKTRIRTKSIEVVSGFKVHSTSNYLVSIYIYQDNEFEKQIDYKQYIEVDKSMIGKRIRVTVKDANDDSRDLTDEVSSIGSYVSISPHFKDAWVEPRYLSKNILSDIKIDLNIEVGSISDNQNNPGEEVVASNRLRSGYVEKDKIIKMQNSTNYQFKILMFDKNKTLIDVVEYQKSSIFIDSNDCKYIRITFKKDDDTIFNSAEISQLHSELLCISVANVQSSLSNSSFSTVLIAANDSSIEDKSVANIVCDGVNDEIEINSAIQSLKIAGGKIILANGHYYIDSLTEYVGVETRKTGIYFPDSNAEIIMEGLTNVHKATNTSLDLNDKGVVIEMSQSCYDSINQEDKVSLIGGHPNWIYSRKFAIFNNLCLKLPNNEKNIVCLDMKYFSEASCDGIFVSTKGDLNNDKNVNPKCIGIRGVVGGNNGFRYHIKACKVLGVGTAFHLAGEHLVMETCTAQRCGYGYVLGNAPFLETFSGIGTGVGIHNLTFINICFEYVWGGIYFGTDSNNIATFIDLNVEEGTGSGGAWVTEFIVREHEASLWGGNINYFLISTDTWGTSDKNLWFYDKQQGKKFKTINDRAIKFGSTSQRPSSMVDFNYQYFDTSLGKNIYWMTDHWVDALGNNV